MLPDVMPDEDRVKAGLEIAVQQVGMSAISAIPFVGPPLAELIGGYRATVQQRRLSRFAKSLAARIERLEETQRLDAAFAASDSYALYVLRAAEMAASSHRDERLTMLAQVAGGAAQVGTTDLWRDKFLTVAESVGAEHMRVLNVLRAGEAWLASKAGIADPRQLADLLVSLTTEEIEVLLLDLAALGLARDSGAGRWDVAGEVWAITAVGQRFLDFLADRRANT